METFSALLANCTGNSPVPAELPKQRPVTRSLGVFVDLRLKKRWENNREAGDLRRYRAHYDVIVMPLICAPSGSYWPYVCFEAMAWPWKGDKPSSQPTRTLLTHTSVTMPINLLWYDQLLHFVVSHHCQLKYWTLNLYFCDESSEVQ